MTAKEQLRERIETLTEHQAEQTLRLLDDLGEDVPRDALDELLAAAPIDDEPTAPEEDEGAREAREQIKRGNVFSAEQIKREIA
ncbi:MAG: hypothetical protein ACR2LK_01295 [Solirubrobacteraceae bacterium]